MTSAPSDRSQDMDGEPLQEEDQLLQEPRVWPTEVGDPRVWPTEVGDPAVLSPCLNLPMSAFTGRLTDSGLSSLPMPYVCVPYTYFR